VCSFDAFLWPARRWLADRLVGDHAYSKNTWTFNVSDLAAQSELVDAEHGSYYRLPADSVRPSLVNEPAVVTSGNGNAITIQRTYKPFDQETA
jgi:hypothetical protein